MKYSEIYLKAAEAVDISESWSGHHTFACSALTTVSTTLAQEFAAKDAFATVFKPSNKSKYGAWFGPAWYDSQRSLSRVLFQR